MATKPNHAACAHASACKHTTGTSSSHERENCDTDLPVSPFTVKMTLVVGLLFLVWFVDKMGWFI
jgi:hypothetical protein